MDDFDFEQRYRDVNECNPFHWHPLHLPEMCADMFEKLIRSKLAKTKPIRIMRERNGDEYAYNQQYYQQPGYPGPDRDFPYPIYEIGGSGDYGVERYSKRVPITPYEKMLELLKKDIKKEPSLPKLGVLPNLGPVAIYNQEISKKSEDMIKAVATAYGKYVQASYAELYGYNYAPDHQLYVWDSHDNETEHKKKHEKKNKHKNDRLSRTKTRVGNVVTIVETLSPRKRRSALYLFGL